MPGPGRAGSAFPWPCMPVFASQGGHDCEAGQGSDQRGEAVSEVHL